MSKATVELDFLGIERQISPKLRPMSQRSSLRGMQGAIKRITPQLLRGVIASGFETKSPGPLPFPHHGTSLPVLSSASKSLCEASPGTAPLTIFYNGTVTVFDLPHDMAEAIIKLAEESNVNLADRTGPLSFSLNDGDLLPIARRKSLQRFLEKRKERLTAAVPYGKEVIGLSSIKEANS